MKSITIQNRQSENGMTIDLIRITNKTGAYVELLNYGAIIAAIVVPDREGKHENVVLGYRDPRAYLTDSHCLGATIGRYANRVSNARFTLDGVEYYMDQNDGDHSIHGGRNGFNKKLFNYRIEGNDRVIMTTKSLEGENGFPGNVDVVITYTFTAHHELIIEYRTTTDKPSPVNLTNHSYFNLSAKQTDILGDQLQVNACRYLETDDHFLPTGRILPVEESAFDFRSFALPADKLLLKQDVLKGYNAYFLKEEEGDPTTPIATFRHPDSGRAMDIFTSMPGLLVYTGDFLSKGFIPFQGICFEAQYPPDGVNHDAFDANIVRPGVCSIDTISYRFYCYQ